MFPVGNQEGNFQRLETKAERFLPEDGFGSFTLVAHVEVELGATDRQPFLVDIEQPFIQGKRKDHLRVKTHYVMWPFVQPGNFLYFEGIARQDKRIEHQIGILGHIDEYR